MGFIETIATIGSNNTAIELTRIVDPVMILGFFFILACGYMTYTIVKRFTYKIDVEIVSRRAGGNIKVYKDRGKYAEDIDGVTKFFLMNRKKKSKPPSRSNIIFVVGFLGQMKEKVILQETDSGFFIPMSIAEINKQMQLTPDDVDVTNWAAQEQRTAMKVYDTKSWVEKYGTLAGIMFLTMFCLTVIIYMADWVSTITAQNLGVQQQIATAMQNALQVLRSPPTIP